MQRYYFDTSIWLDFFEDRYEVNLPKSKYVRELIAKIIKEDGKIVYSDVVKDELVKLGYTINDQYDLFKTFRNILIYVIGTREEFGKAKDLASKRGIPLLDALHALISRNNKSIMVTRDVHFKKLLDIADIKKPEEFI